jgi:hypothetical protein
MLGQWAVNEAARRAKHSRHFRHNPIECFGARGPQSTLDLEADCAVARLRRKDNAVL